MTSTSTSTSDKTPPDLSPHEVYVARLHVDAASGTTQTRSDTAPRSWERVLTLAGAAAGLGAFLIVMGAAVTWVRLVGEGLPAEEGLSAAPKESLAVVGAHVLLLPICISLVTWTVGQYGADLRMRETVRAAQTGEPAPEHFDDRLAALWRRLTAWVSRHKSLRYPAYVLLAPLIVVSLPVFVLSRLRLVALWYIFILPFTWMFVTMVAAYWGALAWARHVEKTSYVAQRSLRSMRFRIATGFVIAAAVTALAGQLDSPSSFPPTTVQLTGGRSLHGLRVAEDVETVVLGVGTKLVEVPRSQIQRVTIGHPPNEKQPDSPLVSLVHLVL